MFLEYFGILLNGCNLSIKPKIKHMSERSQHMSKWRVKKKNHKYFFFLKLDGHTEAKKNCCFGSEMTCHNMREEQQFNGLKMGCVWIWSNHYVWNCEVHVKVIVFNQNVKKKNVLLYLEFASYWASFFPSSF